jgi:hypothetical protein
LAVGAFVEGGRYVVTQIFYGAQFRGLVGRALGVARH